MVLLRPERQWRGHEWQAGAHRPDRTLWNMAPAGENIGGETDEPQYRSGVKHCFHARTSVSEAANFNVSAVMLLLSRLQQQSRMSAGDCDDAVAE